MSDFPCIGIDVGTNNSVVSYYNEALDRPEVILDENGFPSTPTIVGFRVGKTLVGYEAMNDMPKNTKNTIFNFMRILGKKYNVNSVQQDAATLPYRIEKEKDGHAVIVTNEGGEDNIREVESLVAHIISRMKEIAEKKLEKECPHAVITVPAGFDTIQRKQIKNSASVAGFKDVVILNDSTAAAIMYGLTTKPSKKEKIVLIFDLGGGSLEVSITKINYKDGGMFFTSLGSSCNNHLGGDDINNFLFVDMCRRFKESTGVDLFSELNDKKIKARLELTKYCCKAKEELSKVESTTISILKLYEDFDFKEVVTRKELEDLSEIIWELIMTPIDDVLSKAFLTKEDITDLIVIGGSSNIPKVKELLTEKFQMEPREFINSDKCVSFGAAFRSYMIKTLGKVQTETAFNLNPVISKTNLHHEETPKDIIMRTCKIATRTRVGLVIERITSSIGIRIKNGRMFTLIKKNTELPYSFQKEFGTAKDDQSMIKILIYEGDDEIAKNNVLIYKLVISDIPPRKAGDVTFFLKINVNFDNIITFTVKGLDGTKRPITFNIDANEPGLTKKRINLQD